LIFLLEDFFGSWNAISMVYSICTEAKHSKTCENVLMLEKPPFNGPDWFLSISGEE
jgi:hypothetical protein